MARIIPKHVLDFHLEAWFRATTPKFDLAMGKRLRAVRIEMGKTQAEMAEHLGLSQADISRLETGKLDRIPLSTWEFKNALGEVFRAVVLGPTNPALKPIKWQKNRKLGMFVGSL